MRETLRRLSARAFAVPIKAWQSGGRLLQGLALYAFVSPIVVWSLTAAKVAGVTVPWMLITGLFIIGHFNSLVVLPFLLARHGLRLVRAARN